VEWTGDTWRTLAAVAAVAAFVLKFVVLPAAKGVGRRYAATKDYVRNVAAAVERVDAIHKQVYPNGGHSLSDQMTANLRMTQGVKVTVGELAAQIALAQAYHRALAEDAYAGLMECDAEGRFLRANAQWYRWTGLEERQAAGGGWLNAVHEEDRERIREDYWGAVEHADQFLGRFRFRHALTGQLAAVRAEAYPVLVAGEAPGVAAWLMVVRQLDVWREERPSGDSARVS
jgi:PAS domain S-box-containing protein